MTNEKIENFFKNEFKEIGYLIKENDDGKLILPERKIQENWKAPVDDVVSFLVASLPKENLHGIYLRGSVSYGCAIENVSDLDFVVLFRQHYSVKHLEEIANNYVTKKYPFVKYVEIDCSFMDFMDEYNRWLFKVSTKHLYGINILEQIGDVGLLDIPKFVDGYIFHNAKNRFENDLHIDRCTSIMKTIMRELFGTLAHKERVWTRSMYYCFYYFVKNYPDAEDMAKKIVYLAINPTTDKGVVYDVIDEVTSWWNNRIVYNDFVDGRTV
jgi:hypothetical protein